jgi:hypothetical protein
MIESPLRRAFFLVPRMPFLRYNTTALLGLAGIWLLTHRYFGIQHDGLFYAVQALARNAPEPFARDIFLAHGSQDDYSLFSRMYAQMIAVLGLSGAALAGLVAAHLTWATATAAVARHWLSGPAFWIGLAMVFALPGHYGSQAEAAHDILRYAESFLTARSWAEPLVLATLAAALAGHRALAVGSIMLAFLCHPIIALPGGIFLAAWLFQPSARTVLSCAVMAAIAAFLLPEMDTAWLAEVRRRAGYVFIDTWSWGELLEPLAWIGILLAASTGAAEKLRLAWRSLALAGVAGYYLALLGTISHAALLIQAQPWRCLWLLKLAALLALVAMFAARWHRSSADRWLLAGLATAALTAQTLGGPAALALALIAHLAWRGGKAPEMPRWLPIAGYLALAVTLLETLLAILQQAGYLVERIGEMLKGDSLMPRGDLAAYFQGPPALLLPLGVAFLLGLQARRPRLALGMAALVASIAAAGWYRADDDLQKFVYSSSVARPFGDAIAPTDTVHWQGNLIYTWFVLRQSNYASREQGVSALFSRAAAMESARRQKRVDAFDAANRGAATPGVRESALRELCRDPALDVAILAQPVEGLAARAWSDPLRQAPWYLYRCEPLRTAPASAQAAT